MVLGACVLPRPRPPAAGSPRLRAHHPPAHPGAGAGNTGRSDTPSREVVRRELEAIFAASGPEPGWQLEFLDGQVGMVLLEQSRSARMLVIGTREHVGVGRIVHGSVSHFCLDNANCPVAAHPFPPATSAASVDKRPEPATPD